MKYKIYYLLNREKQDILGFSLALSKNTLYTNTILEVNTRIQKKL